MFLLSDIQLKERTVKGVANSGDVFDYQGTPTIVDLSDLSFHESTPLLITHNPDRRAGFGVLSVVDARLMIDGKLLDNEWGNEIFQDADAGFPWQLSIRINPKHIHVLQGDETAIVNGHLVKAPTQILKNGHISEVSFTPIGVDNQTKAHVFSDKPNQPQESDMKEDQYLLSLQQKDSEIAQKQAKIDELQAQVDELTKNAHKAHIEAKLSAKGFSQDEDGNWAGVPFEVLLSLDGTGADAVIDSLSPKREAPDYLFSQGTNTQAEADNPLLADAQKRTQH